MIIDIHTHVPAKSQWEKLLTQSRDNGVLFTVVSSLHVPTWARYPTPEQVRAANEEARDFVEFANGMALWFAYLNPQNENWPEELERCVSEGASGIKLWVSIKREEDGSLDNVRRLLKHAGGAGLPVLLHAWNRTDENLPGELDFAEFATLAREFPQTTMIGAHGGTNWRHSSGLFTDLPNARVDVCGGYPEAGQTEALVAELGADRVLYGSDALGRSIPSQVAKVALAELSDEVKARIFWSNAAKLLNITDEMIARARATSALLPPTDPLPVPDFSEDHFCFCGRLPMLGALGVEAEALDKMLGAAEIDTAYAADARGMFELDILAANQAYIEAVARCERITPLATLMPYAPNWPVQLAEARRLGFDGGIVHPYLHSWRLDDAEFAPFFAACAEAGFPLWINCSVADYRLRHRGLACRPVLHGEVVAFCRQAPRNAYVFQALKAPDITAALEACPEREDLRFDMALLSDATAALPPFLVAHGTGALVHGSEFPFRPLGSVRWTTEYLCGLRSGDSLDGAPCTLCDS
ncbi:MAG: amidohydrolase family protein [Lentisphaeria bacterium]|nr:amidohydrolase family protein [Lentisphaeria bacterium]